MAIDNLNYYSAGVPAGQQTDKYSTNPGCLKSKNLDIFSSSKSVKATAWSEAVQDDGKITDQKGILEYRSDGKVYDTRTDTMVFNVSDNFPTYTEVSYNGRTGDYEAATLGTIKCIIGKYIGDEWESFTVFTDRTKLTYSKLNFTTDDVRTAGEGFTEITSGLYRQSTSNRYPTLYGVVTDAKGFTNAELQIQTSDGTLSGKRLTLDYVEVLNYGWYLNKQIGEFEEAPTHHGDNIKIYPTEEQKQTLREGGIITLNIPIRTPTASQNYNRRITLRFQVERDAGVSDYLWGGEVDVGISTYNAYYKHTPINDKKLEDLGGYYLETGINTQKIYSWIPERLYGYSTNYDYKQRWDFGQIGVRDTDSDMDIISGVMRQTNPYLIGNKDGNGYIIPAPIGGFTETPYIAEGITFKGAIPQDYYLYLVGEDRGVSGLYVYSGQQLVKILGGTEKKSESDLVDTAEQYRFTGKMCSYRGNVIIGTEDNRVFAYGQGFNGRGGAFIHEVPGDITDIKVSEDNLVIEYESSNTKYKIIYQGELAEKNYNTEFVAEYPIVIGNHLLEKEESDLYCSYILPSEDCSLEFWGMANHYHFWSFYSEDTYDFDTEDSYKLKGATGNYELKYVEKNGNRYTFKLVGDLPVQTTTDMKITDSEGTELITYTEYNHFRRIGEITTDEYVEGEFRFTNLNNKLELPKSHSLQIMVRGKGTATHTPELFTVDLVASQRERG